MHEQSVASRDLDSGYENVVASCPECGVRNTYNRTTDIGHVNSIDNHRVECNAPVCGAAFDIVGDSIAAAHDMLLLDATAFLQQKRYMQAVLSATTAFEVFFAHFLQVQLIFRPMRRDGASVNDEVPWMNEVAELLRTKTERHTFPAMRNVFLRAAVDHALPRTLTAARAYVDSIQRWPAEVDEAAVAQVADDTLRALLVRCRSSTIAELRNSVVHKSAYRPSKSEAEDVVREACEILRPLTRYFRLATVDYHLNEPLHE